MVRVLQRDPFARASLIKEYWGWGECAWCGRGGKVYQFYWQEDSGRAIPLFTDKSKYCSVGCWRAES